SLSLSGIGATLEWDDGYTKIKSLVPGGPADLSKQLKPGDKIVSVAQGSGEPVDVVEMRLNKVVELIRGKRGTEVRLTVIPAKAPDTKKVITITRDEIKLQEQYAKARVVEQVGADGKTHRLGVITLPQFYDDCSAHVEKLIGRLKKENIDGLVLDLRKNGGGILDEAISLTGLFIKKGPVVQVKDSRKQIQVMKDDNSKIAYDGPLVVMTSRLSASASEIVAAALQDYGRALVIGDQATHGKGTVQTVLGLDSFIRKDDVPNPGKLKLTVSKFYRVEGGTTQREGVTPDIVLPSVYDYLELGESSIENALPADRINPVSHERVGKVTSAWEQELQSKSRERIKEDRDFEYLFEDIAQVKKQQADKTVSLNEQKRLAEKEEQKAKMEARKKERAARKVEGEKVFELTLEMVDKNGAMQQVAALNAKQDDNLAATKVETPDDPSALEEEDESGNAPDPHLNEGLHILSDYAALLASSERRLADTAAATK
ncbi:MAG TPA: carboxy terminal-processing peptidase, partial [Methylomirabilota bacterium]|nr:carboxy terminal-processing peptidase [Methylomirabilota bacterium]